MCDGSRFAWILPVYDAACFDCLNEFSCVVRYSASGWGTAAEGIAHISTSGPHYLLRCRLFIHDSISTCPYPRRPGQLGTLIITRNRVKGTCITLLKSNLSCSNQNYWSIARFVALSSQTIGPDPSQFQSLEHICFPRLYVEILSPQYHQVWLSRELSWYQSPCIVMRWWCSSSSSKPVIW